MSSGEIHFKPLKVNFQGLASAKTLRTFKLAHEHQDHSGQSTFKSAYTSILAQLQSFSLNQSL